MQPILRPQSNFALLKRSLTLYRRSFHHVLGFSVLLGLTAFLPRLIAYLKQTPIILYDRFFSLTTLWVIAIDLMCVLLFVAILWGMHCHLRNVHEPLIDDFRRGLKKCISVLAATILQAFIIFFLTIFLLKIQAVFMAAFFPTVEANEGFSLLPMALFAIIQTMIIIYVASLFYFVVPIIGIENRGVFSAIAKSFSLVWNHWWRTISLQIIPWFFYLITLLIVKNLLLIDVRIYFFQNSMPSLLGSLLQIVLFILFIPWVAAVLLVQLKDLELRKTLSHKKNG